MAYENKVLQRMSALLNLERFRESTLFSLTKDHANTVLKRMDFNMMAQEFLKKYKTVDFNVKNHQNLSGKDFLIKMLV
jgi:hypothetical protein